MARSLIGGLISSGTVASQIQLTDPSEQNRTELHADFAVATSESNQAALIDADVVVLAVKPQVLKQVLTELTVTQHQPPLFVSIAAGIPEPSIRSWLGFAAPIVRCMPNTPALVQSAATALYANPQVSDAQHDIAESIMRSVGLTIWLDNEQDMDAVTALSGSGPAYFFYVMEAMEKAAVEMGLTATTARLLCVQTAFGAAKLALEADQEPAVLRQRVTSPGGTTEAALQELDAADLTSIFNRALKAARQRSKTLANELGE